MKKRMASSIFKSAATCCLALGVVFGGAATGNAQSVPNPEVGTETGYYWEDPGFTGPPKGLFADKELQEYYEAFLWSDVMKAREIWARKKEDITDLPFPDKLSMLGNFRKRLQQIERLRMMFDDENPVDRMNRGLLPNMQTEDVKWEL